MIEGENFFLRGISSNTLSALTVNETLIHKEDVLQQIEEQQHEITQLRRHLDGYAVKEARIQHEKNVLEKRIGSMYNGFDQQQQDLIEARTKAIAYKQEIMEENVRLGYALRVAQEEESIFVSSLVPLLSDQDLYLESIDAYSIVSNLRILFKHHKERIEIAEEKLRDSQYQPLNLQSHMKDMSLNNRSGEDVFGPHLLPSILEEEHEHYSSSQPEANDSEEDEIDTNNKPLPTIEGLQILGEPFPGNEIQASGYSRKGTTHCGFEWVRYMQDGSMTYIEGAKQPMYTVTADDVDNYLAVLVQPLDDLQRKGNVVKCFANGSKTISCHPDMLREIEQTVSEGHASYNLFVYVASLDTWEPAILEIKKSGYSIKLNGPNNGVVVVSNKYKPTTIISLPAEEPLQFSILGSKGVEQYLSADDESTDVSCSRDAIVLTMRLFVKRAVDKKKKKKKVLFFK